MNLDLFSPAVPESSYHPAFRTILTGTRQEDKEVLNQWAEGFVDRDGKFVKEFQTTFDSSFWELYLNAAFNELGMSCDFRWPRPDFCVVAPLPFLVEATVALHAIGTPAVTDTDPLKMPEEFHEFNRKAIIRLSNSIHAKHKKHVESYSSLSHCSSRPFVIAIAPFDRPHFALQAQRPIEALLYRSYVDEDTYLKKYPDRSAPLVAEDLPYVEKDSGGRIPLGIFCDDAMSGVSAVIHSTAATWSKVRAMSGDPDVMIQAIYENRAEGGEYVFKGPNSRYHESILDGLRVYHNPHARYPLDPTLFNRAEIFQATSRGPVNVIMLSKSERLLVNRTAMTFPAGFMAKVLENSPVDRNYWWRVPPCGKSVGADRNQKNCD